MRGWEPAEFHEPIFENGSQVGVRVTREPEFSPDDVALMLARIEDRARPRNSLGILLDDATDPDNQFAYVGRDAPIVDWAMRAVELKRDAYYEANPNISRAGHIWLLRPRDGEGTR